MAGIHHEGLRMRSGFGFHSKCDGAHERISNRGVAESNLGLNRLIWAVVPGGETGIGRETSSEAAAIIWVRDAGSLDQRSSSSGRGRVGFWLHVESRATS